MLANCDVLQPTTAVISSARSQVIKSSRHSLVAFSAPDASTPASLCPGCCAYQLRCPPTDAWLCDLHKWDSDAPPWCCDGGGDGGTSTHSYPLPWHGHTPYHAPSSKLINTTPDFPLSSEWSRPRTCTRSSRSSRSCFGTNFTDNSWGSHNDTTLAAAVIEV